MDTLLKFGKRTVIGVLGGIGCAITWWLMDRYLFGETHNASYYSAVVFAYVAGTGPISNLSK